MRRNLSAASLVMANPQARAKPSRRAVTRKAIREKLERKLGQDMGQWKAAIKQAAVEFVQAAC